MTSWVGVGGVGVGLRRAVPSGNFRRSVQRERVVFVLDVIVVQIVRDVCATNGKVAEIVGGGRPTHVGVKPVVDTVVVLVKWPTNIIVEITVVIDFTVELPVAVAVPTRDVENSGRNARDGQVALGIATVDGHDVADTVSGTCPVDDRVRDGACRGRDVNGQPGSSAP